MLHNLIILASFLLMLIGAMLILARPRLRSEDPVATWCERSGLVAIGLGLLTMLATGCVHTPPSPSPADDAAREARVLTGLTLAADVLDAIPVASLPPDARGGACVAARAGASVLRGSAASLTAANDEVVIGLDYRACLPELPPSGTVLPPDVARWLEVGASAGEVAVASAAATGADACEVHRARVVLRSLAQVVRQVLDEVDDDGRDGVLDVRLAWGCP